MNITRTSLKIIILTMIAALFFSVLATRNTNILIAQEDQSRPLRVYVDGVRVSFPDQLPYIDSNDRTLVPVRFISVALGSIVDWDGNTQRVTVTDKTINREIFLWVGNREYEINGVKQQMDTQVILTGKGRVMVPLRFVSEALGSYLDYRNVAGTGLVFNFSKDFPKEEANNIVERIMQEVEREKATEHSKVTDIDLSDLGLTGYSNDMQISPQESKIAFSGYEFNPATYDNIHKIVLVDIAMGTTKTIIEGDYLKVINWSPDGSRILYRTSDALILYHIGRDEKEKISDDAYYGAFSDDGSKLAYTKRNDGLYIYNIYNGARERISKENDAHWPLWYSANENIFYFTDLGIALGDGAGYKQGLGRINTVTKEKEILIPEESGKYRRASWMIQDKVIYVMAGWDDGFYDRIIDLEEGRVIEVGENDSMSQYALAVSPHERLIKAEGDSLFFLDRKGSKVATIKLNNVNDFVFNLAFNPVGDKIAFLDGELGVSINSTIKGRELKVISLETELVDVIGDFAYYNQPQWIDENNLVTIVNAPVEDSPFLIKVFSLE